MKLLLVLKGTNVVLKFSMSFKLNISSGRAIMSLARHIATLNNSKTVEVLMKPLLVLKGTNVVLKVDMNFRV